MKNEKIVELLEKHEIEDKEDVRLFLDEYVNVLFHTKIEAKDENGNISKLPIKECVIDEIYEMEDLYEVLRYVVEGLLND